MKNDNKPLIPKGLQKILDVTEKLTSSIKQADQLARVYASPTENFKSLESYINVLEKLEQSNWIKSFDINSELAAAYKHVNIDSESIKAIDVIRNNLDVCTNLITAHETIGIYNEAALQSEKYNKVRNSFYANKNLLAAYETFAIDTKTIGYLEKFDEISRYTDLSQKTYHWHEALKIQKSLGLSSHIEKALHGLNIDNSIFNGLISELEYKRAFEITSALSTDSVFFGEFENADELEEDNEPQKIILPEEFKERLKTVQFLPIKLFEKISNDPNLMHEMDPIDFENFIAGLLDKSGFENIIVTPRSGDKGRDILATQTIYDVPIIFAFECKKYAPHRKIQPDIMRALLGTISHAQTKANKGVLVTTSSFTRGAKSFIASESMLSGKDFNDLVKWINQVKK